MQTNPNYKAVLLQNSLRLIENDSAEFTFIIKDENGDLLTSLSAYKFGAQLDNGGLELKKKDSNYSDGSDSQISVSGEKITVYVDADDTDTWSNDWWSMILQMTHKTTGARYTVFRKKVNFIGELLDW